MAPKFGKLLNDKKEANPLVVANLLLISLCPVLWDGNDVLGNVKVVVRLHLGELQKVCVLHIAIVQRVFHPPAPVVCRKPALDGLANEAN